eukprot:gene19121-21750_t
MSTTVAVGIDVGSQKTMMAKNDADIVRTDTGSTGRATLLAFDGKERLCGEEAFAHVAGESTVTMINVLLGKRLSELNVIDPTSMKHRKVAIEEDESGRLTAEMAYGDAKKKLHVTALMGMFLAQLKKRLGEETKEAEEVIISLALPPNHAKDPSVERAYREASTIAGIVADKLFVADATDCLVATYTRKIAGLNPSEREHLEGKHVLLLDMGHTHTTAVVVLVENVTAPGSEISVRKVGVQHDEALGAYHFDLQLFDHFAAKVAGPKIEPGSKKGFRLLSGCERIRKLLSQLGEAQITVEHLAEDTDVSFALKRDELGHLCEGLLGRFKDLLNAALFNAQDGVTPGTNLGAIEVLGGGVRMQVVQQVVHTVCGQHLPFGFKLDDSAIALGAALLAMQSRTASADAVVTENPIAEGAAASVGLTPAEVDAAYANELSMQAQDYEIKQIMAMRNKLESFILEMRSAPGKKHGQSIDRAALNNVLDDAENWLWEAFSDPTSTLEVYEAKHEELQSKAKELCAAYFAAVEVERAAIEKELEEEAVRGAAEREAEGGDDEDHDTRKLKKADRMRLVVKNKEEGTELFKDKNFRPAAARYQKALTHCAKFFDLNKEDEAEVK